MKICLLGSMRFLSQEKMIAEYLEKLGHEVQYSNQDAHKMVPYEESKIMLMKKHIVRIEWSDAVIAINMPAEMDFDHWVESYIGCNTLGEIFIAWYLGKKLYSWFEVPKTNTNFDELKVMNVKVWEPRYVCSHPKKNKLKILQKYEVCKICGTISTY
jgi:hypothetical protein